jgi:D-alanyl-D-alanine dipeptidase
MNNETPGIPEQKLLTGKLEKPAVTTKNRTRKKPATRKSAAAARRAAATRSRNQLVKNLRKDLDDARATLKVARTATKAEIAMLKDQLNAALKREKELLKISEKKVKKMIAAGERWEKKQLGKLKKAAEKIGISMKK